MSPHFLYGIATGICFSIIVHVIAFALYFHLTPGRLDRRDDK